MTAYIPTRYATTPPQPTRRNAHISRITGRTLVHQNQLRRCVALVDTVTGIAVCLVLRVSVYSLFYGLEGGILCVAGTGSCDLLRSNYFPVTWAHMITVSARQIQHATAKKQKTKRAVSPTVRSMVNDLQRLGLYTVYSKYPLVSIMLATILAQASYSVNDHERQHNGAFFAFK